MPGPREVSWEDFEEFCRRMERKYHYDDMDSEEQALFRAKLEQVAVVRRPTETGNTSADHPLPWRTRRRSR